MRFLIIGGSDAGISAALRAREIAPDVEVTVVLADDFPNFSICGLPFFLSGETPDWRQLAHRTEFSGIELMRNCTAQRLSLDQQIVEVTENQGTTKRLRYDRLLIATGAVPIRPPIAGLNMEGVYTLHTMEDSFRVHAHLNRGAGSALIIGSGYIGLEMADALIHRGMKVTLVGRSEAVLPTVDHDFGKIVEAQLEQWGVSVHSDVSATGIERNGTRLVVHGSNGFQAETELVLVGAGVIPNSRLASEVGIEVGYKNAIRVNRRMETSQSNVFAAGDCAETWHRVLQRNVYLPLGTTSHKQGRIAGENAMGGNRQFAGSLGTQIVKVFDLAIGRTGLRQNEAREAGFSPVTATATSFDHKVYYPGARKIQTKITGDGETGRLLGAQMIGHWQACVAKRIDVFATAVFHKMGVEDLNDLDLSYTPPLGSPWDVVQSAAQSWAKAVPSAEIQTLRKT